VFVNRWLERQMDPEQLARMRERQRRFQSVQKWEPVFLWAWAGMLLIGGLVWLAML
jgi:hypothetical protein